MKCLKKGCKEQALSGSNYCRSHQPGQGTIIKKVARKVVKKKVVKRK